MIENNFTPATIQNDTLQSITSHNPMISKNQDSIVLDINCTKKNNTIARSPRAKYKKREQTVFTFEEYVEKSLVLNKYTIPLLKQVCKNYKLHVSGKKDEIINRITRHFTNIRSSIIIQKYVRRYYVKIITEKHRENNELINLCVNDTDFSSLEPLCEIDKKFIYCYQDADNFAYGFHICSLIELIRNTSKLCNPYNRMLISKKQKNNIINVYNLSLRLIPSFNENDMKPYMSMATINRHNMHTRTLHSSTIAYNRYVHDLGRANSSYVNYHPIVTNALSSDEFNIYRNITEIRGLPIQERINKLFMEIDQLGNYTQSEWFNELSHLNYARLYRSLYDIWNYRGQLSPALKRNICPFHGPFEGIFPNSVRHVDLSTDDLKRACLIVIENMTYCGITPEIKQIGIMHAMTALTIVSRPAREALPWLYDSIAF
jgi:hypothetical protein